MRSAGVRYFVVGLLALLMFVPLFFAGAIVDDRQSLADRTRGAVGREWGGPQIVSGPVLAVPVEGDVVRTRQRETRDPDTGELRTEAVRVTERGIVGTRTLLPDTLDLEARTETEIRYRGIFDVPVYAADVSLAARFEPARLEATLGQGQVARWDGARLQLGLGANAGLRGAAVIEGPDGPLDLEPFTGPAANPAARFDADYDRFARTEAAMRDPGGVGAQGLGGIEGPAPFAAQGPFEVTARLELNGAQRLLATPVGRESRVTLAGDWPDPSFTGAFLPDARDVDEGGFEARWSIPHLARTMPQVDDAERVPGSFAFGVEFVQVGDFYQKAWRAARYGILFIALTFLTVLLIEPRGRPTHPVQYVLIGLAQSIFVLLMVAYAEQIGFTPAYLLSAGATIALLTMFGWIGLKLGKRAFVLGALLVVLYAVLYLILRSTDYALLAGATLAFGALALTMVMTRNEDWYGPEGPGRGLRRPKPPAPAAPPPAPPAA